MNRTLLLSLFLIFNWSVWAQDVPIMITGSVVEEGTNMPIPGTNVLEKGTGNGTMTNMDGEFSLQVSRPDAVVVISFMGFKNYEFEVGDQREIDVVLEIEQGQLDEVVVIGE